jgi:hypothetical protein
VNVFRLTFLSNVVAYACRPSSQRIGMMFISIDSRLVRGHQMIGGKGAKGGNLESAGKTGPADDVAKRQKLAETAGNSFLGPYSGAKVFSGAGLGPLHRAFGDWRIACGNCGTPHDDSHQGFVSALGNLGNLQAGKRVALAEIAEIAEIAKAVVIFGSKGRKLSLPALIAVRKNSRSPRSAPAQYRVVPLLGRRVSAAPSRRPRCLTGMGVAPILPHRKNGLKSRKDKAF